MRVNVLNLVLLQFVTGARNKPRLRLGYTIDLEGLLPDRVPRRGLIMSKGGLGGQRAVSDGSFAAEGRNRS